MSDDARQYAPSAARNREPIWSVLQPQLPPRGLVLEVASGSGEHTVHFARAAGPQIVFQPSDPDVQARASIDAWVAASGLPNIRAAIPLDAAADVWPITSADVVGLYKSAKPLWPDGMPMLIVLRPADDSDNDVLAALFPGMAEAIAQLRQRRDLSVAATDQDNADMAERMNGSLVGATLAQIRAEKRNLRFVALDGIMPSLEAYLDGSYPHGKLLYLIAPATPGAEAKAFVDFLAGPAARSRLRDLGLVAGAR